DSQRAERAVLRFSRAPDQRRVNLGLGAPERREVESVGQNAGDGVRLPVEQNASSDHGRLSAEPPLPKAGANDHHARSIGPAVLGKEGTADSGAHPENVKKRGRGADSGDLFGLAIAGEAGTP